MNLDLSALSFDELTQLKDNVTQELDSRRLAERQKLLGEFRERAKALGISPKELIGSIKPKSGKTVGAAKYANPEDRSQTWTGKGKRPGWVHAALNAGKSLQDLAI